ncbi:MAG TPA: NADH-quinone oxidoreductase subunit G, partial [Alphaproteobacteria bacterium]|nr:NADH-quinone oxidoreductase subunit G [Alphaproteobacteria bacterium]
DWAIIRACSEVIGKPLPFDTITQLRAKLIAAAPTFANMGEKPRAEWKAFGKKGAVSADALTSAIDNFYMTNPICRASVTMAKCTEEIRPLTLAEAAE